MSVFITGGTSGIGQGLAQHYLARGYRVGICGRNAGPSEQEGLSTYRLDVTDKRALETALGDFCKAGSLDILILSAGAYCNDVTADPDEQQRVETVATNIAGTVYTLEAAAQYLQRPGGRIAVIASVSGLLDYPQSTLYAKSKRAVIAICDAYRQMFAASGTALTCVMPGYTDTPKLRQLNEGDLSHKPFVVGVDYAVGQIVNAIDRGKDRIAFPPKMHRLIRFLTLLPKPLLAWIMLKNKK